MVTLVQVLVPEFVLNSMFDERLSRIMGRVRMEEPCKVARPVSVQLY